MEGPKEDRTAGNQPDATPAVSNIAGPAAPTSKPNEAAGPGAAGPAGTGPPTGGNEPAPGTIAPAAAATAHTVTTHTGTTDITKAEAETSKARGPGILFHLWRWGRRFGRLLSLGAAFFGFWVVVGTALLLREDIEDRQRERIGWALERLFARQGGDTAKGTALTQLFIAGQPLNFNLSCEAIGEWENDGCSTPVTFRNIELVPLNEGRWGKFEAVLRNIFLPSVAAPRDRKFFITNIRFDEAVIEETVFDGIYGGIDLTGATIRRSAIINSTLMGGFRGATFSDVDLTGSHLAGVPTLANFGRVAISNAAIDGIDTFGGIDEVVFIAWADALPRRSSPDLPEGPAIRFWYEPDGRKETAYPPLSVEVLSKIRLCAPPTEDGEVVPLMQRPTLVDFANCERVDAKEARAKFVASFRAATEGYLHPDDYVEGW